MAELLKSRLDVPLRGQRWTMTIKMCESLVSRKRNKTGPWHSGSRVLPISTMRNGGVARRSATRNALGDP